MTYADISVETYKGIQLLTRRNLSLVGSGKRNKLLITDTNSSEHCHSTDTTFTQQLHQLGFVIYATESAWCHG